MSVCWPAFADDLMAAADFDIDYIDNGLLHLALSEPASANCERCGATKVPHAVCESCGYYRGRDVLALDA